MKYLLTVFVSLFLVSCAAEDKSAKEIYTDAKNGVVKISFVLTTDDKKGGSGTGFIIGDNMIVTNDHVVSTKDAKLSVYSVNSKRQYDATIVHTDPVADLAVIKLNDWDKFVANENPTILSLGDSEKNVTGSRILVMGHPWGLDWTISEGIISAKDRRVDVNPKFVDQVDAHIFNGNSGGPIFNTKGEVICVSELMFAKEGGSYGFCIPSNLVKKVLYDFQNFGEIRWRAMNISIGLTDDGSNAIIKTIEPNGAAYNAGLMEADKILKLYTEEYPEGIDIKSPDDIITQFALMNGDEAPITLLIDRGGKKMNIEVKTNYRLSKEYQK